MDDMKFPESGNNKTNLGFYKLLGIPLLKKIIMGSIGKFVLRFNRREDMPSYFVGFPFNSSSLELTLKWSYFNEVVHILLILLTAVIGYFFLQKEYTGGALFMGIVILLNIGLALLQHLNRIRIHQTIKHLENRKIRHSTQVDNSI